MFPFFELSAVYKESHSDRSSSMFNDIDFLADSHASEPIKSQVYLLWGLNHNGHLQSSFHWANNFLIKVQKDPSSEPKIELCLCEKIY